METNQLDISNSSHNSSYSSSQFNSDDLVNNDVDNGWRLVQNEKIDDLTSTLKQLVKYDGNLFEIFSKIQIKEDHPNQLDINNNNDVTIENNIISGKNKLDLSDKPNIVKQYTPTVEEKIDYIMKLYQADPFEANYQMFNDTGDLLNFIFISLYGKKDNIGYEFEKFKNMYTPSDSNIDDLLKEKLNSNNKKDDDIGITLQPDYMTKKIDELFDRIKEAFASIDLKSINLTNEDSSNLSSKTATDKNKSFWRYACSFLKNIFLDLTLIYPVCEIFLPISNLKNIEMQTKQVKQQVDQKLKQQIEEIQLQMSIYWMMLGDQVKQKIEQEMEQEKKQSDEAARKVFKQISKKNMLSILNAIVCTLPVLLVCSLIFAWGPVFSYVFLFASSALLIYKSVERYRQERRKYFAAKAIQYFKPENSSIGKQFIMVFKLSKTKKKIDLQKAEANNQIKQIMDEYVPKNNKGYELCGQPSTKNRRKIRRRRIRIAQERNEDEVMFRSI